MQPSDKIKEYLNTVSEQIRWKKARPTVIEEIKNHMIDQRDAYIRNGAGELAATEQAIAQMGDPVDIGTQLDRAHRPKPQTGMLLLTLTFVIIGLTVSIFVMHNEYGLLLKQLLFTAIGVGLMIAAYFADFTLIGKYPKAVYFTILALSAAALLLSPLINGRFYYAAFMPLLYPLGFCAIVYALRNKGYTGIVLCGFSFILPAFVVLFIPSTQGFLLFAITALIVLCTAISKGWFKVKKLNGYLLVFIPVVVVSILAILLLWQSYRWERFQAMLDPSADPYGAGFIGTQIKMLLQGSRFIGHGVLSDAAPAKPWLGNDTDYLLTYLIFNCGWIVFIVIAGLLILFITKGFLLCFRQKSCLALFVSLSVMMTFAIQAAGYVFANLGLQLITPISLPMISHNNTASVVNLLLIGIMLSAFRAGSIAKDNPARSDDSGKFITYSHGKLIISLKK